MRMAGRIALVAMNISFFCLIYLRTRFCHFCGRCKKNYDPWRSPELMNPITVSIGLCTIAADAILTDAEVQRKANKAKEFAKKSGKNCIAMSKSPFFLEKNLHIA